MSREKLIPKMRFEDFIDKTAWIQNQLKDMSQSYSGGTPSVGNTQFYNGNIPFIRSGEIYKDTTKLFITEEAMINSSARMVHKGDILYALYGATSGEVSISKIDGAINQAILAVIPDKKYDSKFLEKYLNKEKEYILNSFLQGGQGNLSGEIIRSLNIIHPSFEEQQKIGSFFEQIDKMIQLQQSKVNKVKDIKSAYLSEMFPKEGEKYPKKRFEGLKNNWNPATFSDFLKTESFKKYLAKEDRNGIFPIIQQGDSPIEGYGDGIPYKDYDSVVLFGDHTLSLYRPESPFLIASDGIKILSNNKMDRDYFYYLLQRYIPESEGYKRHYSILKNKVINITENKEEQVKIGNFFKNLDNQISIEEEKLVKLEKLKQAYLNEMFV